jgi:hypothetical protein
VIHRKKGGTEMEVGLISAKQRKDVKFYIHLDNLEDNFVSVELSQKEAARLAHAILEEVLGLVYDQNGEDPDGR